MFTLFLYFRSRSLALNCNYKHFFKLFIQSLINRDYSYAPAVALSIVTEMSIPSSIVVMGLVVTVYTSMGGLKGVIWTDFFQFAVMVFGLVSVAVTVCIQLLNV
jgi:Na+/pantothenate symporter